MSGIVVASLLTPTLGYGQLADRWQPTIDESTVIEYTRWAVLGTLVAVGYFVYGIPDPHAAGYMIIGAIAGYVAHDRVDYELGTRKK